MSFDTTHINRHRHRFEGSDCVWLFAYGSLIFRPDFAFIECQRASICGWTRKFWQGSHDHRGTPQSPGRVATLIPAADQVCDGMAYLITPAVFDHLDHREKNGYLRVLTELRFDDGRCASGLVYIADADNAAYLGPASEQAIAQQIANASGPSGSNRAYLLQLADALRAQGSIDLHVFAIEQHLLQADAG